MHDQFSKSILWLWVCALHHFQHYLSHSVTVDVIVGESGENDLADVNPTTKLRWSREPHGYDIFTIW